MMRTSGRLSQDTVKLSAQLKSHALAMPGVEKYLSVAAAIDVIHGPGQAKHMRACMQGVDTRCCHNREQAGGHQASIRS